METIAATGIQAGDNLFALNKNQINERLRQSLPYIGTVMKRIRERFSPDQVRELEEILGVIDDELMPEVRLENGKAQK